MATQYAFGKTVTNGLTSYINYFYPDSLNTSTSVVTDLTLNGYNAVTNGVFDSASGYIVANGATSGSFITSPNLDSITTTNAITMVVSLVTNNTNSGVVVNSQSTGSILYSISGISSSYSNIGLNTSGSADVTFSLTYVTSSISSSYANIGLNTSGSADVVFSLTYNTSSVSSSYANVSLNTSGSADVVFSLLYDTSSISSSYTNVGLNTNALNVYSYSSLSPFNLSLFLGGNNFGATIRNNDAVATLSADKDGTNVNRNDIVAVVFRKGATPTNNISIYYDGNLRGSTAVRSDITTFGDYNINLLNETGGTNFARTNFRFIQIFNRELNATEILNIYNISKTT